MSSTRVQDDRGGDARDPLPGGDSGKTLMFGAAGATRAIDSSPIDPGADRKRVADLGLVSGWDHATGLPAVWGSLRNARPAPPTLTTRPARADRGRGLAGRHGNRGGRHRSCPATTGRRPGP